MPADKIEKIRMVRNTIFNSLHEITRTRVILAYKIDSPCRFYKHNLSHTYPKLQGLLDTTRTKLIDIIVKDHSDTVTQLST